MQHLDKVPHIVFWRGQRKHSLSINQQTYELMSASTRKRAHAPQPVAIQSAEWGKILRHCMNHPWLTTIDWPLSAFDSNPAKNSVASATSSTVVNSPSTVSFRDPSLRLLGNLPVDQRRAHEATDEMHEVYRAGVVQPRPGTCLHRFAQCLRQLVQELGDAVLNLVQPLHEIGEGASDLRLDLLLSRRHFREVARELTARAPEIDLKHERIIVSKHSPVTRGFVTIHCSGVFEARPPSQ